VTSNRALTVLLSTGVLALIVSDALSHGPRRPPPRPPVPKAGDKPGSIERGGGRSQGSGSNPIARGGKTGGPTKGTTGKGTGGARPGSGTTTGKTPPRATTGRDERDGQNVERGFVPGTEGMLAWNTTRPVGERPILVYLFNCEDRKGEGFDFARVFETQVLRDKTVLKLGRQFACERICYDSPYFLDKVKGREMMHPWLEDLAQKSQKSKKDKLVAHVVFLDADGKLIDVLRGSKQLKSKGSKYLAHAMKKALKENEKRKAKP
jgi:hypothetical protein